MKINTVQYVRFSDLFRKLDQLNHEFGESDPDMTWGDTSHSLVTAQRIVDHLDDFIGEGDDGSEMSVRQLRTMKKRVEKIGPDMLVDLAH